MHFFGFFYFRFCFFLMGKEPRSEVKALAVAHPFSTCKVFINTVLFQMAALGPRSAPCPGRMHGEIIVLLKNLRLGPFTRHPDLEAAKGARAR